MITRCLILHETSLDSAHNLAVESALLASAKAGECTLYLWQNQHTVVIGLNQDPWQECRIADLMESGGRLVRRPTGGGAVYHDLGNLNFSFILPKEDYDVPRQLSVILEALRSFGLVAEATGRNDITLDGLKFSGNAFLQQGGFCLHHGTLLVDADLEKLSRYLMPSGLKLQSKGIPSVRARVTNLRAACEAVTVAALRGALAQALGKVYRVPVEAGASPEGEALRTFEKKYRSQAWILGRDMTFDRVAHDRFPWGEARVGVTLRHGVVTDAALYTDAMDTSLAATLRDTLVDAAFTTDVMRSLQRAYSGAPLGDILGLLLLTLET